MNIAVYILAVAGAFITFGSKMIADFVLSGKREPNEADTVIVKAVGLAFVIAAFVVALVL